MQVSVSLFVPGKHVLLFLLLSSPYHFKQQANGFAADLTNLLNRTVTVGLPISTARPKTKSDHIIVGYKVSDRNTTSSPIPLRINKEPEYDLDLSYQVKWLEEENRLTTVKQRVALSEHGSDSAVEFVAYDYSLDPENEYPQTHIHINYMSSEWERVLTQVGRHKDIVTDLHFPAGDKFFRPSIEDLIEFCVVEGLVEHHAQWKETIEEYREKFYSTQADATVRKYPNEAAETLRSMGWLLVSPE